MATSLDAAAVLAKAGDHMKARATTYDKPGGERSMGATVNAFNAIHETGLTEAQGWHFLQLLKDVRLFQRSGYHADSAEDCVSYAALKAEAKAKEAEPGESVDVGTELYRRIISFTGTGYDNAKMMRDTWSQTPFIIDAYTGHAGGERLLSITSWCRSFFGPEARFLPLRAGAWQIGNATISGRTWIGFSSQRNLDTFLDAFPDAIDGGRL